jgi:RNA polymerase sigma-70 factor (ECF subfamily)
VPAPSEDKELLKLAADGDDAAAGAIFDKYSPAVLRFLTVMLGDIQSAEDAVQETFLALFRSVDKYDPAKSSLGTWLRRLAFNFARNEIRRRGRKPTLSMETMVSAGGQAVTLGDVLAAKENATRDASEQALELLANVDERDREILVLRYLEGLPPHEIGPLVGLKPKAVSMRIWRALSEMRRASGIDAENDAENSGRNSPFPGQEGSGAET